MDSAGTNLGERFAAGALSKYYETTVVDKITNSDYEGQLSEGGADRVHIITFGDLTMNTYAGTALTADDPSESEGELILSVKKAYYFQILSLNKFEAYVKNPESALLEQAGKQLAELADSYVLGLYADTGSGNRVGTNYTTGTVTVTVTTGECVGVGTTWTSAMAGLGFKATGHSKWYRIVAHATHAISATSMYIENDSDDDTTSYDGGAISGAAYTIEATTVLTLTAANVYGYVNDMAQRLDENKIPRADRWLVVNSRIAHILRESEELTPAVATAYEEVVKKGLIGEVAGFQVYQNEQVSGNNTTGYYIMAGHKSAITFAMAFKETAIEDTITGNFGKAYKGLVVYGAKILDERRKALAYMWCKV